MDVQEYRSLLYKQRIGEMAVEYEEKIAGLRIENQLLRQQVEELTNANAANDHSHPGDLGPADRHFRNDSKLQTGTEDLASGESD